MLAVLALPAGPPPGTLRPAALSYPVAGSSAVLIVPVPVPVLVRVVIRGGSALTGRVGRHSTAGLAVVAAAGLAVAQFDEGVGRRHPQLGREGGVVGGPVGQEGHRARFRPRFLTRLWHNATIRPMRPPRSMQP